MLCGTVEVKTSLFQRRTAFFTTIELLRRWLFWIFVCILNDFQTIDLVYSFGVIKMYLYAYLLYDMVLKNIKHKIGGLFSLVLINYELLYTDDCLKT